TIQDLSHCSVDLITSLDKFYTQVEEMRWYLFQTEDMPNTVEDYIDRKITRMGKFLETLNLYLDAELGISGITPEQVEAPKFIDAPEGPDFSDSISDDVPQES